MLKIDGLGVKNLRSLTDSGLVSLKPINILVGRNSAGKSTFARLLPLLKQSSERRKQSPILWYGRLVDFGSFDDAHSTLVSDGFLDITVRFNASKMIFLRRQMYWRDEDILLDKKSNITATFRLESDGDDGKTLLRELRLEVFGVTIKLQMNQSIVTSVIVNDDQIEIPSNIRLNWTQGQLMPILRNVNIAPTPQTSLSDESLFVPRRVSRFGATRARNATIAFLHGNTQEGRVEEIVDRLPIAPIESLLKYCQSLPNSTVTWKSLMAETSASSASLKRLHNSIILYKLDLLLSLLDDAAQRHLADVNYLEPLRATAQRYYRREEVSTDELDPKGLNTPFFIQGLTSKERESFQAWTSENFGFSLSVKNTGGHLSLIIQPSGEGTTSRNMADVGLGYSQLVPVALQLWAAKYRVSATNLVTRRLKSPSRFPANDSSPIVVVEQPELHLHPAYQAKIANVFASAITPKNDKESSPNQSLTIIAETHSPTLVSRLGELINEGKLPADSVQILVFEDDALVTGATKIRVASFDEEGILKNWPIGFFDS